MWLSRLFYQLLWKFQKPFIDNQVVIEPGDIKKIIPEKIMRLPFGFIISPGDCYSTFKLYKNKRYQQYVLCFRNIKTYDFYLNKNIALIWEDRSKIRALIDARDMVISPLVNRVQVQQAFEIMGFKDIKFEN